MNAIQEAIAAFKEWQAQDPQTRFMDGNSMSGEEAWRACLLKVCTMLEAIQSGVAVGLKPGKPVEDRLNDIEKRLHELEIDRIQTVQLEYERSRSSR